MKDRKAHPKPALGRDSSFLWENKICTHKMNYQRKYVTIGFQPYSKVLWICRARLQWAEKDMSHS